MIVKPRAPVPFRPLQLSARLLVNQQKAAAVSAQRIISLSGSSADRTARKSER